MCLKKNKASAAASTSASSCQEDQEDQDDQEVSEDPKREQNAKEFKELPMHLEGQALQVVRRALASRLINSTLCQQLNLQHTFSIFIKAPEGCGKTLLTLQMKSILQPRTFAVLDSKSLVDGLGFVSESTVSAFTAALQVDQTNQTNQADSVDVIVLDNIDDSCWPKQEQEPCFPGQAMWQDLTPRNIFMKLLDDARKSKHVLLVFLARNDISDQDVLKFIDTTIELRLPDVASREQILKAQTQCLRENRQLGVVDFSRLAAQTCNFTPRDLQHLVSSATQHALARDLFCNQSTNPLALRQRNQHNQKILETSETPEPVFEVLDKDFEDAIQLEHQLEFQRMAQGQVASLDWKDDETASIL